MSMVSSVFTRKSLFSPINHATTPCVGWALPTITRPLRWAVPTLRLLSTHCSLLSTHCYSLWLANHVDLVCHAGCAKTIVYVHDSYAGGATVEHGKQGRYASKACTVSIACRDRNHRL